MTDPVGKALSGGVSSFMPSSMDIQGSSLVYVPVITTGAPLSWMFFSAPVSDGQYLRVSVVIMVLKTSRLQRGWRKTGVSIVGHISGDGKCFFIHSDFEC